jgi:hypothetical protein
MKGTLKPFDSSDYEKYDKKGKVAFLNYLNNNFPEFKNIENPNKFGIDILSLDSNNEVVYCWEIEVRYGNWKGNTNFQFKDINCIERKDYLWKKDKKFVYNVPFFVKDACKVYYVQLNDLCSKAVIIDGNIILNFPLIPWKNRKAEGEFVRQVPINLTNQISLV